MTNCNLNHGEAGPTAKLGQRRSWANARNEQGSILIWTVLLGVMLTSVFFFLATRLSGLGADQRDTIQHQNQKAFLNSYVAYLMEHSEEINTTFNGIEIELTKNVDEITGIIDSGVDGETFEFSGSINIDWNSCDPSLDEDADIIVKTTSLSGDGACTGDDYKDSSLASINVPNPFTIRSLNAPFHYLITPDGPTQLKDNEWHLNASINLGYGRKIEVKEIFEELP